MLVSQGLPTLKGQANANRNVKFYKNGLNVSASNVSASNVSNAVSIVLI